MDTYSYDVIVIGAGIVGATAAAQLSRTRRVALVEAEEAAGYHSTGRSAAVWLANYGSPDAQILTRASREFLVSPPVGFSEAALCGVRGSLVLAREAQEGALRESMVGAVGLREISIDEAKGMVPAIRGEVITAAVYEAGAADLDVSAIHQGYLRQNRLNGGGVALRARAGRVERVGGDWEVEVTDGSVFRAPVVVNAAGAWGDEVAGLAGVRGLGLVPMRRTACIVDPGPWAVAEWPMINDMDEAWYCRPEMRTKLMVSPADETPVHAHDVQPDDYDVAVGIDAMQQALAIDVRRVERSWAGLRTFTPDRGLAVGFDPVAEGFFWCVGQGGYGIQTSPAVGRLVAGLVSGAVDGDLVGAVPLVDPGRFS